MILGNKGQVIVDPFPVSEETNEYLGRFWNLPTKEDYEYYRKQLLTSDNFSH